MPHCSRRRTADPERPIGVALELPHDKVDGRARAQYVDFGTVLCVGLPSDADSVSIMRRHVAEEPIADRVPVLSQTGGCDGYCEDESDAKSELMIVM